MIYIKQYSQSNKSNLREDIVFTFLFGKSLIDSNSMSDSLMTPLNFIQSIPDGEYMENIDEYVTQYETVTGDISIREKLDALTFTQVCDIELILSIVNNIPKICEKIVTDNGESPKKIVKRMIKKVKNYKTVSKGKSQVTLEFYDVSLGKIQKLTRRMSANETDVFLVDKMTALSLIANDFWFNIYKNPKE